MTYDDRRAIADLAGHRGFQLLRNHVQELLEAVMNQIDVAKDSHEILTLAAKQVAYRKVTKILVDMPEENGEICRQYLEQNPEKVPIAAAGWSIGGDLD